MTTMTTAIQAYEREPYRRQLAVTVHAVERDGERWFLTADDTVLFPAGGGQPSDRGWLRPSGVADDPAASLEVDLVERRDGAIRHWLAAPPPAWLTPGVGALLEVDWSRRFDHMQQHTAQHLITALALDCFGWPTTAFHLGATQSDIELAVPALTRDQVADLEERVAAEIRAARPVSARRVTPDELTGLVVRSRGLPDGHQGDVRLVEIAGLDLNTCGGTHVGSTAELEAVKLLDTETLRGGTRLYWVAGGRTRRRLAAHEDRSARLRRLFDSGDDDLVALAERRVNELRDAEREIKRLRGCWVDGEAQRLASRRDRVVVEHYSPVDAGSLQPLAQALRRIWQALSTTESEATVPELALLTADGADVPGGLFALVAGPAWTGDLAATGRLVAEGLAGRGGGAGGVVQGKASRLDAVTRGQLVLQLVTR